MSRVLIHRVVLPLGMLALVFGAFGPPCQGAAQSLEPIRLDVYRTADGEDYFGLAVQPAGAADTQPRDMVVLFDTSASQAGKYRADALAALGDLLENLGPEDRIKLIAADLHAIPLSDGFVEADGPEMAEALEKLNERVPLGSTDMPKALRAIADSYDGAGDAARAAIYIGDGMSTAHLLGTQEFEDLATALAEARIPVSGLPIGPKVDHRLLGALAATTGGNIVELSEQAGAQLAAAARAAVYWPKDVKVPDGVELYPKPVPPLRSDRASVLIGTYSGKGPIAVDITAAGPGGPTELGITAKPGESDESNAYLAELVDRAEIDGGVSLPLVGVESLAQAQDVAAAGVESLSALARQALVSDNLNNAEQLAGAALEKDPGNPEALAVKAAIEKKRGGDAGPAAPADGDVADEGGMLGGGGVFGPDDFNLVGGGPGAAQGAFAQQFGQERRIVAQVIKTQVQNAVNQARGQMGTDPEGAMQNLKLQLETVKQAPDLDPEVRDQLVDVIQSALRAASRRRVEIEQRRQEMHERIAAERERRLIAENLMRNQQRLKQLMDRFDSLMKEGRYRLAEEGVGPEAAAVAEQLPRPREPGQAAIPEVVSSTLQARTTGYLTDALALRVARQKAMVDTLYQVERSHVPFPDEPPIVYPDAEVWQELTARRVEKYKSMDLASRGAKEKEISDALQSPTQLEFIETPLQDVVDYLKDFHDIEIQIDKRALGDVGIGTDTPITKNLKGISLRSALRLVLRELDLTYVIQDEVLLVTTPEEAANRLTTKVYPVADLVLPIQSSGFSGGFGGLGGLGGFGSGMMGGGGGMQGGAFGGGGMGGGMGGMGGGMGGMGMGMMNVPAENLRQGFRAFAVKDDLSKPPAETAERQPTDKIHLTVAPDSTPGQVWDKYFQTHDPSDLAVLDAVQRLHERKKYDHVVALIHAALRHQHPQPWMHEALVLAMQASGQPREEIERALTSALDFVENPADMMHIGAYLVHLGFDKRALDVFHQVSKIAPTWPEPYMLGLKTARRIDDLEGIQWATVGILSQAWTEEQAEIGQTGMYVAAATLQRLQREGRQSEAREYERALDNAVRRDVEIRVSWTGEADVDLLVEEPSGTVCSVRNPRTTAGGVMLGDSFARLDRTENNGYNETYVCPKGFDGDYRVLLRRVWGEVTGGKVHVEVINHNGSDKPTRVAQNVSLKKDKAVVLFQLNGGRRAEPLAQHQIANAAMGQAALNHQIGRQVLAQQLAAGADPAVARSLALSRVADNGSGGIPFNLGGAVGYQPVIITLPEGANLAATAVVSADRRYVRITSVPLFSGVAEVNVFNTSSGANTQGRGGTGGQGFSGLFGNQGTGGNNNNNNNN